MALAGLLIIPPYAQSICAASDSVSILALAVLRKNFTCLCLFLSKFFMRKLSARILRAPAKQGFCEVPQILP